MWVFSVILFVGFHIMHFRDWFAFVDFINVGYFKLFLEAFADGCPLAVVALLFI